jgi:hypothetical protein
MESLSHEIMAIVVRGATCSLGEAVVDRLLSWDIDVVVDEKTHAERNSTMLKFSPVSISSEGEGFSISFDGSDADIVIGKDIIVQDLLPSRADKWLAPEIPAWIRGEEIESASRYWLCVLDAAEGIAHITRAGKKVEQIQMCGRREWQPDDSKAELLMLWDRTNQGISGEFTSETLFGHPIAGMEVKPMTQEEGKRPDLSPLHEMLVSLDTDGWRPLIPFRTALMNLIAGLK